MAEYKHISNNYAHVLVANDVVDLQADYTEVWLNGPGGTVELAPGEAASVAGGEARLYGAIAPAAATWEKVTPTGFPTRYIRVSTGGTWTIYAFNAVGRRMGRA